MNVVTYHTVAYEFAAGDGATEMTATQVNNGTEESRDHSEQHWEMMLENLNDASTA